MATLQKSLTYCQRHFEQLPLYSQMGFSERSLKIKINMYVGVPRQVYWISHRSDCVLGFAVSTQTIDTQRLNP